MQLGMIGLAGNMVRRLMKAGHQCVVYDVHPPAVKALAGEGATGGNSYYHDDIRRPAELEAPGIHYVDVGTSGGVFRLERA